MSASHHHDLDSPTPRTSNKARVALALLLVPFIVATAIGAVLFWPENQKHRSDEFSSQGQAAKLVDATATIVFEGPCPGDPSGALCETVTIKVTQGPDKGDTKQITLIDGPGQPQVKVGDKLVVGRSTDALGTVTYYFADFQRDAPLIVLGLIFAVLVVLIGRWRGFGSLIGLVITWLTITHFLLPSIMEGNSPVFVALIASAFIVLTVQYAAHGLQARTTVAIIGTLISLGVTGLGSWMAVRAAHLTGISSEEAVYVQTYAGDINLQGLLLAGFIIGALGVLNDMTVTQASAAWELHIAQPFRSKRALYKSTMRIGRDHIASTVYTLALAYTGAALPLLVVFTLANKELADVATSDIVSEELVRTLVGSIGIILSVPITSALAAVVAKSTYIKEETDSAEIRPNPQSEIPSETQAKRFKRKKKLPTFEEGRKISRRERKFWKED